jgi:hypothetical protein
LAEPSSDLRGTSLKSRRRDRGLAYLKRGFFRRNGERTKAVRASDHEIALRIAGKPYRRPVRLNYVGPEWRTGDELCNLSEQLLGSVAALAEEMIGNQAFRSGSVEFNAYCDHGYLGKTTPYDR